MPSFPAYRNLNSEIQGIGSTVPYLASNFVNTAGLYNPQVTAGNVANYAQALRGNFDAGAFDAANPGWYQGFQDQQAQGQLAGWTPEQYALATVGNNQGALDSYYRGGVLDLQRSAFHRANPELTAFTGSSAQLLQQLNASQPGWMDATGYTPTMGTAASAGPAATAAAATARVSRANGGPLLGRLEQDAGRSLGQVSPLQLMQQRQAMELLGAGGNLTQGELQGVQDSARAAYSDRGRLRGNRGIGAEILATDSARRGRLLENLQLAQGVDSAGQAQLGQNRNYALGVQGQGQNLSTYNTGQANILSQFNAGLLTQNNQFNAGQGNEMARVNAGLDQQMRLANQGAANQAGMFNATATNAMNQFNQNLRFANNDAQWGRQMQYGNLLNSQRQDPQALAGALMGNTPDYTSALLNYGSDLNNTNFNAAVDRYYNARNNRTAGLSAAGQFLFGPLGGFLGSAIGGLG